MHEDIKLACIKNIEEHSSRSRACREAYFDPPVHIAHLADLDIICTDKRQAEKITEELKESIAPILKRQVRRLRRQILKDI